MKLLLFLLLFFSLHLQAPNIRLTIIEHGEISDVIYLHCHGLGGNQKQAFHYCKNNVHKPENQWVINYPLITFDFPDVKHNGKNYEHGYDKKKVTLAQQSDLDCLAYAYETALERFPDCCMVGHGVSRGGAAWLNFCALYKPKNVRVLIIESPFDDPISVLKNMVRYIPGSEYIVKSFGVKFLKLLFPLWDEYGIKPIDIVDQIPKEIPILFIHSKEDSLIHYVSSQRLCKKLIDSGHEVYCLILPSGGEHATVIYGKEAYIYINVVHAFFKKCGLPHQLECALQGEALLEECKI